MTCRLILILALTAWSTSVLALDYDPSKPIERQIEVTTTEFDRSVLYLGPDMLYKVRPDDKLYVQVRAAKNKKTGEVSWGVLLQAQYEIRWRFYESANLAGGKVVPASSAQRNIGTCSQGFCTYLETILVKLDDDDMRVAASTGLRLRWNGRVYGSFEVEFQPDYVRGLEEVVRRY